MASTIVAKKAAQKSGMKKSGKAHNEGQEEVSCLAQFN